MTSQVAITLLKSLEQSLDSYCELNDEGKTAFSMAISALELFGKSEQLPSSQPERLTDDDFETIRIHLNSFKENLCNQRRWKEAEEYQRIIDRFIAFASTQPRRGKWIGYKADDKDWQRDDGSPVFMNCSECHETVINNGSAHWNFCPNCGADMRPQFEEGEKELTGGR